MHPGMKRAWLQTAGLPLLPSHAAFRAAFDTVDRVEYLGSGCAKLFDEHGGQVGILQFQHALQASVDDVVQAEIDAALEQRARTPDIAAGDTLIRPLDVNDADDVALLKQAADNGGVIMAPPERDPVPPIDLPDFDWPDAPLPDNARTSPGVAAAITGNGGLATKSTIPLATTRPLLERGRPAWWIAAMLLILFLVGAAALGFLAGGDS